MRSRRAKYFPKYRSFLLTKPLKSPAPKVDSGLAILKRTYLTISHNWPYFLSLFLVLSIILLGLVVYFELAPDLSDRQIQLKSAVESGWQSEIAIGFTLIFEAYQSLIVWFELALLRVLGLLWFLLASLTSLYLVRAIWDRSKKKTKLRIHEVFYFGPSQIIPFFLVISLIIIQALPFLIAIGIANYLRLQGVVVSNIEQASILLVVGLVGWLSTFWLLGSLFAPIVASLPGSRPGRSWFTSLMIVRYRRWLVFCHILLFLVVVFIGSQLALLPFAIWWVGALPYVLYLVTIASCLAAHFYFYDLYRELIKNDN